MRAIFLIFEYFSIHAHHCGGLLFPWPGLHGWRVAWYSLAVRLACQLATSTVASQPKNVAASFTQTINQASFDHVKANSKLFFCIKKLKTFNISHASHFLKFFPKYIINTLSFRHIGGLENNQKELQIGDLKKKFMSKMHLHWMKFWFELPKPKTRCLS